jgi:hypothetical protein
MAADDEEANETAVLPLVPVNPEVPREHVLALRNLVVELLEADGVPFHEVQDGPDIQLEVDGDPDRPLRTETSTIGVHDEGDHATLALYAHNLTAPAVVAAAKALRR